ncbi:hypothetical protein GCM10007962_00120 [Yeosuana aromativorans]|uniref:Uncharacterized protein n=1 Tax=Yeosuana aromativorans TaxID=288019 RepID=A0A8J3BI04_9FLAO|nr:hypothetical protein [Yeosuana aromativorans]GGK09915.1 hypothetical protein GCM10007962_00120 [Yeosuana aromativorans]
MPKRILFFLAFIVITVSVAQQKDSLSIKNGIDKPSILATHHFGIFSSRINQNFKIQPDSKSIFTISYVSGNTFHPFVETYIPKDPTVQKEQSQLIWYHRNFNFIDQETTPADYMNIVIDAVIKEFRATINIPINKKHELDISLRSYLITKGNYLFSPFTNDETIEWFHSNIAGGEDPYGRKYYGLNQVNFKYTDRNGRVLELHNNDFFISGIEFNHFYYPSFLINKKKNVFANIGTHLGFNTSKYNPSLDIGLSVNVIKKLILKSNNEFHFAAGTSVLRKNIINFGNVMDLGNNPFLATLEGEIEFTKYTKKKHYNAFGINYQIQSRYNKLKEADYYKLIGKWKEIHGGWQHGITTLYKALSNWTFLYTYGHPKYKISLYLKEDFRVNNAPDIQTGIGLTLPLCK